MGKACCSYGMKLIKTLGQALIAVRITILGVRFDLVARWRSTACVPITKCRHARVIFAVCGRTLFVWRVTDGGNGDRFAFLMTSLATVWHSRLRLYWMTTSVFDITAHAAWGQSISNQAGLHWRPREGYRAIDFSAQCDFSLQCRQTVIIVCCW